jgi:predicted ATPase
MPSSAGAPNPFQPAPGASPPILVGRAAEVSSIEDACERVARSSAPTPLVFLGLRGLGKTVLLNEVRSRTPGGVQLRLEVEKNASLTRSIHSAIALLQRTIEPGSRRFGKAIESALRHIPLPSYELPHDMGSVTLTASAEEMDPQTLPVGRAIAELAEAVAALKRYLVITVDEVQNADIVAFQSLVAVVHQRAGTANPILLASGGLPEAATVLDRLHTYVKRWDRFELDFLTRAETVEAIRVPLSQAGVTIEDDALDLVVSESAGYPFFVQKYASTVWNRHRGKTITLADVDAALPGVRAMVEKTYYADEFRDLSPRERLFCKILASLGPGAHQLGRIADELGVKSSAISSIRGNLIKKGIVFAPSSGMIAFRMPLADRYVRDHASFFFDPLVENYQAKLTP